MNDAEMIKHLWTHKTQDHPHLPDEALMFERGEGIYVWNREGRRFIDAFAGLAVVVTNKHDAFWRVRVVDALLTNFHLPQSTLLMLVSGVGRAQWITPPERATFGVTRFDAVGRLLGTVLQGFLLSQRAQPPVDSGIDWKRADTDAGRALFGELRCVSCHSVNGAAAEPAASPMAAHPTMRTR